MQTNHKKFFSMFELHPFHIVQESWWPILMGGGVFCVFSTLVLWMNKILSFYFLLGALTLTVSVGIIWARDIIRESSFQGFHTTEIEKSLKWSMMWFISSEILFFFAFFWGFFHFSLSTVVESGNSWPPLFIEPMEPFSVPLLNTLILLSSGVSLTWAHHSIIGGNFFDGIFGLFLTVILGIYFTGLQLFEYCESSFTFNDSLYGSIFFLATGFHGLHVLIGTLLLLGAMKRHWSNQFSSNHHMGLETASWYWHFVDVVWLFLFCCVYWWGS